MIDIIQEDGERDNKVVGFCSREQVVERRLGLGAGILDKILQWGGKRVIVELQGLCTERLPRRVYTERVIWAVESEEVGKLVGLFRQLIQM